MTPPLSLRDEDGDREIVALDEEAVTQKLCYSGRVTVFLNLAPGLEIKVGSRCVNKRRFASVTIKPAGQVVHLKMPQAFQELKAVFDLP
jgi:hypothetical protein